MVYICGTNNGSSGSPILKVLNEEEMVIAGIHRGGYGDEPDFSGFNHGTVFSEIIQDIRFKRTYHHKSKELMCNNHSCNNAVF